MRPFRSTRYEGAPDTSRHFHAPVHTRAPSTRHAHSFGLNLNKRIILARESRIFRQSNVFSKMTHPSWRISPRKVRSTNSSTRSVSRQPSDHRDDILSSASWWHGRKYTPSPVKTRWRERAKTGRGSGLRRPPDFDLLSRAQSPEVADHRDIARGGAELGQRNRARRDQGLCDRRDHRDRTLASGHPEGCKYQFPLSERQARPGTWPTSKTSSKWPARRSETSGSVARTPSWAIEVTGRVRPQGTMYWK